MLPARQSRPDPDALLSALKKEEENASRGKLRIFFGMCAGVGKTFDMLKAAHEASAKGIDVVVGYAETHKRAETDALLHGLTVLPRKVIEYRGTMLEEMDLDAILARKPSLVLVDELAHSNAPGCRHTKRFQDVLEILGHGIDVWTTLNVQHLESRAETVQQITGSVVRETVPDSIFDEADDVEIVDIPPDELLKRLAEGKVYSAERSRQAIENFFRKGNLTALREMALRLTAERVDHQLRDYMQTRRIAGPWKSGQRLIVAISPSPQSASLIRWARRISYTMNATLVGVSVETSATVSREQALQRERNIKLAEELGAEIITTADENVADALIRVAREQNATQILLGKPGRVLPFRKSLLDQVIERSGNLDVYVGGGDEKPHHGRKRMLFPAARTGGMQYAAAAGIVSIIAAACYPMVPFIGYQTVSLILLLSVALLPLALGAGPVILAAAWGAMIWNFFFIPPRFTFAIASGQDILMVITYFVIAAVTGTLTAKVRARERAVRQREERATALYSLTKDLSVASGQDDVARLVVTNIHKFFAADVAVFLSDIDGDIFTKPHEASTFTVDEKEFSVAVWVYWNERKAGRFTDTLPFASATYYPMSGPRYPLGVIGVRRKGDEQFSNEQEILLQNFVRQIASTLEREQLNEIAHKSMAFVESEQLYKTLFNSISHELRTPVAAIVSASDVMRDPRRSGTTTGIPDLAEEIHTAAERLNRLIDNLLDMARLESGRIKPRLDWCDTRDIVNATLQKLGRELSGHRVVVDVPANMPLVTLDFVLVEQILTNLLHNASQYTPPGSEIRVATDVDGGQCRIVVSDNGPGFREDVIPRLFEKFFRVPGSKSGGTGLGLSIVQGFVAAHQGTITVANRKEGGAEFTIKFPTQSYTRRDTEQV